MSDKFVTLKGGLDLATPPSTVSAGAASEALNYFEAVKGGYTRIAGYEKFDGQAAPYDTSYWLVVIEDWDLKTSATPVVVGASLTVDTVVFEVVGFYLNVEETICYVICIDPVGTIPDDLDTSPVTFDTTCSITSAYERGEDDEDTDKNNLRAAQGVYRALIGAVPGSGTVNGVAQINGDALAWRDDGTGDLLAYKSSSTGWVAVDYAQLVVCAATTAPSRGDECNSGAQTVLGVYDYLDDDGVIDVTKQIIAFTGTALAALDTVTRDSDSANIGNVESLIPYTFSAGGKIRSILYNFFAGADTRYLYFTDGVNMAGVYKPEYNCIQPIATNYRLLDDVFTHIESFGESLWLSTAYGTAITSVPGEPEVLDGFLGSVEWGAGDVITGFGVSGTDLLHIFTKNTVQAVKGTGPSNFIHYTVSDSVGAKDDSLVTMDDIYSVSARGINTLKRTAALGGFNASTISDDIQPLMRELNPLDYTGSVSIKELNQIRLFFGNRFLMLSRVPYFTSSGNEAIRMGITEGKYDASVDCISSGERADGSERIIFGSDDGFVYETDVGTSYAGDPITSSLTLHRNNLKSPEMRKRFRSVSIECSSSSFFDIRMYYTMNDGRKTFNAKDISVDGASSGGYDFAQYDYAVYDAFPLARPQVQLVGTGFNIEFSFYHQDDLTPPFSLTGYTLRYSNRGLTR